LKEIDMNRKKAAPSIMWRPDTDLVNNSNLRDYRDWLQAHHKNAFDDYESIWRWSIEKPSRFWESIWEYFAVSSSSPYREVMSVDPMPYSRWFEGSRLNYAEHLFRRASDERPALLFQSEREALRAVSWRELRARTAALSAFLRARGVRPGDRVAAFLPTIPEATTAFMATCALGAVWSSCSPDFGVNGVVDRFGQIEPKVLFVADGYQYNGKVFDKMEAARALVAALPTLETVIFIPYLDPKADHRPIDKAVAWREAVAEKSEESLRFEQVPFSHPIWVLYSSGTTGAPKAIAHSHGGVLLEHLKYLAFHNDVHEGERFFWYSTAGWMMWNFAQAALLLGASVVLYDGSPAYPDLGVLWRLAEQAGIHHFGVSAPYLVACMREGLEPGRRFDLRLLRSIGSTGAPLPPEAFDWVYRQVKKDIWLCSMSGGTDVCTAFVGGCPWLPVYKGEIQCRALGCALEAYDDEGRPRLEEVGEMVLTQPMPSMPVYFWNDPGHARYLESYFDTFPGVWRHGDWVRITKRGTLVIEGRSDATLNRQGIRIGTAEIYRAVETIAEVKDSLIVNLELSGGRHFMPLFVVLIEGARLDEELRARIRQTLRDTYSPRHVPDEIVEAPDIPYTISGKKLEAPVKKILLGHPIDRTANLSALRNPEALDFFVDFARRVKR
jgi:acetoacetyl-CoA synthetase